MGWAGHPPAKPLDPPMTVAEASEYASRVMNRWHPVVTVLKRLQGVQEPQAKEVEEVEVEEEENGQWLSIMVADRGNTRGYNHILGWGRIIIGEREYTTPGGKSVGIIHARTLGERFFILGLEHKDGVVAQDFPSKIIATRESSTVVFDAPKVENVRQVWGGFRRDYSVSKGSIEDVFIDLRTVRIELVY